MLKILFYISIFVFLFYAFNVFSLSGFIIDQLHIVYPNKHKRYLWYFGTKLRWFYFFKQFKNGKIQDDILQ